MPTTIKFFLNMHSICMKPLTTSATEFFRFIMNIPPPPPPKSNLKYHFSRIVSLIQSIWSVQISNFFFTEFTVYFLMKLLFFLLCLAKTSDWNICYYCTIKARFVVLAIVMDGIKLAVSGKKNIIINFHAHNSTFEKYYPNNETQVMHELLLFCCALPAQTSELRRRRFYRILMAESETGKYSRIEYL